jgi:hypothetical protein
MRVQGNAEVNILPRCLPLATALGLPLRAQSHHGGGRGHRLVSLIDVGRRRREWGKFLGVEWELGGGGGKGESLCLGNCCVEWLWSSHASMINCMQDKTMPRAFSSSLRAWTPTTSYMDYGVSSEKYILGYTCLFCACEMKATPVRN